MKSSDGFAGCKYVVVAWRYGIPYMLQMRRVLNWYFDNNRVKEFKTLVSAERDALMVRARWGGPGVRVVVYRVFDGEGVCADEVRRWERECRYGRVAWHDDFGRVS
ncbi:MAG: hypothetical protein J6Y37_11520 [Paludibacteraceae bacterium]|nr:hypothetical protein [Paludibacteraceae bacterium]